MWTQQRELAQTARILIHALWQVIYRGSPRTSPALFTQPERAELSAARVRLRGPTGLMEDGQRASERLCRVGSSQLGEMRL